MLREDIEHLKKLMSIFGDESDDICSKNHKPSREFDKKFDAMVSFKYEFPMNLTEDEVWKISCNCIEQRGNCDKLKELAENLTYSHFPYNEVEKLDLETKVDILRGMASDFNYDDIVWWAIEKKDDEYYEKIKNEIYQTLPKEVSEMITWHMSPQTYKKIKMMAKK